MDKAEQIKSYLEVLNLNTQDTSVEDEEEENLLMSKFPPVSVAHQSDSGVISLQSVYFIVAIFINIFRFIYGIFKRRTGIFKRRTGIFKKRT